MGNVAALGTQAKPIVVVGGGVVGLASALRLARAFPDVVLVERDEPGMACSFGNAGHVATEQVFPLASPATLAGAPRLLLGNNGPLSIRAGYAHRIAPWLLRFALAARPAAFRRGTAALASLQSRAIDALARLCADAGIPEQLHRRGHLILVENPRLVAEARRQIAGFAEHGIAAEWLEPAAVAERIPGIIANSGAIHVLDTAHVGDPLTLSRGLLQAFVAAGGTVLRDEVTGIERRGDNQLYLRLHGRDIATQRVVIAAGAWSRPLAAQTGFDVPLDTERGYHVTIRGWRGGLELAVASLDRMTIMTPLDCGLRMTGFVELGGLTLPPDPRRPARLHGHLSALLPGAPTEGREEWMGFRPSLPDHLPVIGSCPDDDRICYAFGHQHLGLTLAGVTADVVLELCTGTKPDIDLAPFRIDRF